MTTYRQNFQTIITSLIDPETGELWDYKNIDTADIRALTNELRAADGDIEKLQNSHAWKRIKKTMVQLRIESQRVLDQQERILERLADPTFVKLATWGKVSDGRVLVPIVKKNRQKLDAKEAAIYRLEANLWKTVEGRNPPRMKRQRKVDVAA
jgi:hypothetical protein